MRVSLFITCLVDNFYPEVGKAMVHILDSLGITVDFPRTQTCCGQPAFNSGYVNEARGSAKTLLDAFEDADYVVTPSGSCAGMIHHYYAELFADQPTMRQRAQRLVEKTYEFSQFLVNIAQVKDIGARFPHTVTYHPSCHGTRLLGIDEEPMTLLRHVRDIRLLDLPYANDCCGFGGTFSVKMGDISSAMVSEKVGHVRETGAEVLVGGDMGCLMNIGGRLRHEGEPVRVMHFIELLYDGMLLAQGVTKE